MSERSTGSQYDASKVDGNGEQRRQQNQQSNQAGGQQGASGGSMGAGPVSNPPRDPSGRDSNPGPRDQGLADQVNQGLTQADPQKTPGTKGSSNSPGDANGSGSMGSTRRDDAPRAPRR